MKKSLFAGLLSALLLVSCAAPLGGRANLHAPIVSVVNGQITVDQPTLHIPSGDTTPIVWVVTADQYTFAEQGIVFPEDATDFECHRVPDVHHVTCTNKHTRKATYKYTIKLDGTPPVLPLDPWVDNG
jgi:hypothetical protein